VNFKFSTYLTPGFETLTYLSTDGIACAQSDSCPPKSRLKWAMAYNSVVQLFSE